MKKTAFIAGGLIFFFVLAVPAAVRAQANPELLEVVKDKLKEKTVHSGTLDIFDDDSNGVRNLRLIKMDDNIIENERGHFITADYRDINSGEIVAIEIRMVSSAKDFLIKDIEIKGVRAAQKEEGQEDREYTDSEIQACMTEYLKKQGQFTDGKVMLFDKEREKMRHLELTELKEEVRRMGTFYSSSSKFTDADSGDILDIDISVQKKKGKLKVQALRIRNVRKGLVGKDVSQ